MTQKFQITSQRKVFKLSATFFIAILTLTACKKEPTNIGDGLEDGSLNLMTTDTFTIVTYSEKVDSIETDETAVNLLGSYVDPDFGKVDCGIVTQLRLSSNDPKLKDSSDAVMVVDSVVLSLRYTSINYYANLQPMTFEVYKISNTLARDDQEYYAFDSPTITGTNLIETGTATIMPDIVTKPIVGDVAFPAHLRLKLDPAFGAELITASENGDLADDNAFTSYLKGLYIKVDGSALTPGMGTILYFVMENSVSNLTLYFHNAADNVLKEYAFEFNSSGARYNDIKFDRTGTDVEAALNDPSKGKEAFYVQGSAVRGVIEIPHIMDFNYDSLGNWDPKIILLGYRIYSTSFFGSTVERIVLNGSETTLKDKPRLEVTYSNY
ncbi:MAG: DUF4270 family protein [Crocinitomicaceae bacterium]|nr:DUF4270 family protein [Crocinitomicaceae bacterium]